MAAIGYGHAKDKKIFDENDWSQTDEDISPYAKSKTLAEKTAWNFIKELSNENNIEGLLL